MFPLFLGINFKKNRKKSLAGNLFQITEIPIELAKVFFRTPRRRDKVLQLKKKKASLKKYSSFGRKRTFIPL